MVQTSINLEILSLHIRFLPLSCEAWLWSLRSVFAVFLVNCFSLWPEILNLAVNSTFHRLGILPEDDFCISHFGAKEFAKLTSHFLFNMSIGHWSFVSAARSTFFAQLLLRTLRDFAMFSQRVHIGISRSLIFTSSTTKRSALLIAFEFVPVFLFCTVPQGYMAWVAEHLHIRCQGSRGRDIDLGWYLS